MSGSELSSRPDGFGARAAGRDAGGRVVVGLHGEHDIATTRELSDTLARVIGIDDSDLVVDLSDVGFMDASTVGVLLRTKTFLVQRGRSLALRSPTDLARRTLELCGIADLVDPERPDTAGALGSWVAVPARARQGDPVRAALAWRGIALTPPAPDAGAPVVDPRVEGAVGDGG